MRAQLHAVWVTRVTRQDPEPLALNKSLTSAIFRQTNKRGSVSTASTARQLDSSMGSTVRRVAPPTLV